jgi:UDP-N-acetylglucosamine 2-epimerase (non-hydrolysing)
VVGTRPNFMKIAPIARALEGHDGFEHALVHTGQHHDDAMSRVFFEELGLPDPDVYLGVGSASPTRQTARILEMLEDVYLRRRPDAVLVPGDVTSTLAAALAAVQQRLPVVHVEAGLRSFDRTMPEEINRILTDQLSDLLLTHSPEARTHLLAEGRPVGAIHEVGNTMIDTLVALRETIARRDTVASLGLTAGRYVLVTLHRPALVDGPLLTEALAALTTLSQDYDVVFPVHPRTRARLDGLDRGQPAARLHLLDPLGYLDFLHLTGHAAAVLTDSGGVQEETTYLGVPCFTLRDNTERPVTVHKGTNVLLGLDPGRIVEIPALLDRGPARAATIPDGWDGHAAERIVGVLERSLAAQWDD